MTQSGVLLAPTLTSISPNTGAPAASVPVTLAGTNFISGATVNVSNSGVTVSNVNVAGANQITATFVIAANAAGSANVTVTTSGGTSGGVSFGIDPAHANAQLHQSQHRSAWFQCERHSDRSQLRRRRYGGVSNPGVAFTNVNVVSGAQITATLRSR